MLAYCTQNTEGSFSNAIPALHTVTTLSASPLPDTLPVSGNASSILCFCESNVQLLHTTEKMQRLTSHAWLALYDIMFSRLIHVSTNGRLYPFIVADKCIIVDIYCLFFKRCWQIKQFIQAKKNSWILTLLGNRTASESSISPRWASSILDRVRGSNIRKQFGSALCLPYLGVVWSAGAWDQLRIRCCDWLKLS